MKLKFKHLQSYPLGKKGIKARCDKPSYKQSESERIGWIESINIDENEICIATDQGYFLCGIEDIKLITHPLSSLTKEIDIDGNKFIAMLELFQCSKKDREYFDIYGELPEYWQSLLKVDILNDWSYKDVVMLFRWGFNVFNLPENLIIDISTT